MYEIDFEKVAKEYYKDSGNIIATPRIKAIYSGKYPNVAVQIAVKKLIKDSNGNTKKKFLKVDYNKLSKVIYEKYDKVYVAGYLKNVHKGVYQSNKVLGWINEILS